MKYYLAIDPGREKCGIAVLQEDGEIIFLQCCYTVALEEAVSQLLQKHAVDICLVGDGTGSGLVRERIGKLLQKSNNCDMMLIDEASTTEQARALYWRANPPSGWRRLLPLSLLVPPKPIDDWAAVVMAQRWLKKK